MKLIRVIKGVYRTENNEVRIFYSPWQDKQYPWVMVWDDVFSCRKQKRFRTLVEARNELKEGI